MQASATFWIVWKSCLILFPLCEWILTSISKMRIVFIGMPMRCEKHADRLAIFKIPLREFLTKCWLKLYLSPTATFSPLPPKREGSGESCNKHPLSKKRGVDVTELRGIAPDCRLDEKILHSIVGFDCSCVCDFDNTDGGCDILDGGCEEDICDFLSGNFCWFLFFLLSSGPVGIVSITRKEVESP